MLQLIRDKAQGIIIWIIVGLVILALSSFILNSYLGSSVKSYVAKVNDHEISDREYQIALNNQQQQLHRMLGDNFAKFYNAGIIRQTVINQLITNQLLQQLTSDAGFQTSPQQVAAVLQNTPAFKQDGKFSSKQYQDVLAQAGYTPELYENDIANEKAQQQFESGISESAFILKSQAEEYLRLLRQQRDTGYLMISMPDIAKGISVSDAQIKQYYDAHKAEFMTKEQVKLAYLYISKQKLAEQVQVSPAELQAYYKSHLASFTTKDYTAAKKKIEEIAAKIKKGASFAEMAKKFSQDPSTASKGGEFGYISRHRMPKSFEDAAFKLKVGEVSEPVLTQYGYQLIRLDAIRKQENEQRKVSYILIKPDDKTAPFDKVQAQIKQAVQLEHADKTFYQDADKLDRLSYEYQDSLDTAADKTGLKIQDSPFISRQGGPGLWSNPDVIKAAFSDDVLKGGLNSDLIKIDDNQMIVLRLKQHKAAEQKPLAEVKQQIAETLKQQMAGAEAEKLATKFAADIQKGQKPQDLAAGNQAVSWTDAGYIGRQQQYDAKTDSKLKVPAEIRKLAFSFAAPKQKPAVLNQSLPDGSAAVLVVKAVRDNTDAKQMQSELASVQQQMQQSQSSIQKNLLIEYERANSKIDIVKQQDNDQNS